MIDNSLISYSYAVFEIQIQIRINTCASAAPDIPVTDYKGPVASISTLGPSVDAAAAEGGETLGQDGHEQDELHLKIFKSAASGI